MKKLRIGVDVDGVLADFLTPTLALLAEYLGEAWEVPRIEQWDLDALIPEPLRSGFWDLVGREGFCSKLAPYPGAFEGMSRLAEVAEVHVVTSHLSSSKSWVWERDAWIRELFPMVEKNHVHHTKGKHVFHGDFLVDDKVENVLDWLDEHRTGTAVLWEQPYNARDADLLVKYGRSIRTSSWERLLGLVQWTKNNRAQPRRKWRVGKSIGRTLYVEDLFIGVVDTQDLARRIVEAMNERNEG